MKQVLAALVVLGHLGSAGAEPASLELGDPGDTGAAGEPREGGAGATAGAPPDAVLRPILERFSGFLAAAEGDRSGEIRAFLRRELGPHLDVPSMARWAAGHLYYRLTPAQQTRLTERLSELLLGGLARNLGAHAEPHPAIHVYPSHMLPSMRRATVRALVTPPEGYPVRLDFHLYRTPAGWKVYDVAANGESAVGFYRRYFTTLLRRYGPEVAFR